MLKLSSSVGRGAPNQKHDVALIQSALASLPANPAAPFGQKIWTRPADGRVTPDLEQAIRLFQSNNRITQTARIDPMGPDMQTLDRTLPQDRKGLAVVEQCSAVLCGSVTVSGMGQANEALRKLSLLPSQAAEQLGDMARDLHKQTGLVLCPDGHGIDQQGRLVQRLTFAETHWLDNSGRFTPQAPLDKAREVVAALHRRPLPGLLEWHKGPMPFGSAPVHLAQRVGTMSGPGGAMGQEVLAVRARQGLACLSGMHRPLDPERMRRVGLRRTGDIVADRMLDVAAAEIEAGNAGANELGIIGDILKGIFDDGATGIQHARGQSNGTNTFEAAVDDFLRVLSNNFGSAQFAKLRSLVSDPVKRLDAYAKFRGLVANRKPWDIKRSFQSWVRDPVSGAEYGRDMWGNIHYGYLGRAAGFSEFELLNAAGWAQYKAHVNNNPTIIEALGAALRELVSSWDDPKDQEAIKLGIALWEQNRGSISREKLVSEIRNRRTGLNSR